MMVVVGFKDEFEKKLSWLFQRAGKWQTNGINKFECSASTGKR